MVAPNELRFARLRKGLTLDEVQLMTNGKLNASRLSRIERGLATATPEEVEMIQKITGASEELIHAAAPLHSQTDEARVSV
jgi:transcriptional regulator with XRE-family HTH domain